MKRKMLLLGILFLWLTLLFSTNVVQASSFSSSTATVDWTTWYFWTDGSLEIEWAHLEDNVGARAWNSINPELEEEEVLDEVIPWGTTSASTSVVGATGEGWTFPGEVGGSALAQAVPVPWSVSDGGGARYVGFDILGGAGYVHVSVDYYLEQDMQSETPGDYADGYAMAGLYIGNDPQPDYGPYLDEASLTNRVWNGMNKTDSLTGTLSGSYYFEFSSTGENYGKTFVDVGTLALAYTETPTAVRIDIKPGSCPNPLNVKAKGVLPIAVLGAEEFDVTTIDPASIRLIREGVDEGEVAPLRWAYEDVATPFEGELCDCHELNGDGYLDLTLKFSITELVQALNLSAVKGETVPLTLSGNLTEEAGGASVSGQDCILVLNEGKK
ncbi:MAG: hypothetical protein SWH78_17900 [Thermodesulfobacteriota bacterium]|nr:hypothetical protein [Thermodesulfobacteriota bacterium]